MHAQIKRNIETVRVKRKHDRVGTELKFVSWLTARALTQKGERFLDAEKSLVETTVFVVGFSPFWATLRLPRWTSFMKKYVADHGTKLPKGLPHGHFEVIRHEAAYQVAVFRYSSTEGCHSTSSTQHSKLHLCQLCIIKIYANLQLNQTPLEWGAGTFMGITTRTL